MDHKIISYRGKPTCKACGYFGAALLSGTPCHGGLNEKKWAELEAKSRTEQRMWASWALAHPEMAVHDGRED